MEQEYVVIDDIFDALKKKALGEITPQEYRRYIHLNKFGDMQ